MSPALVLYVGLTLALAAFIVAHAALTLRVLRDRSLTARQRALALVPPVTPVVAWKSGIRAGVILWSVLMAVYVGLQIAAQV